jgi:hypothetical protein
MAKQKPQLPKEVAEKYDCTITPTVVIINSPKAIAGRYDLTKINLEQADRLAKNKKYLVEKPKASSPVKKSD